MRNKKTKGGVPSHSDLLHQLHMKVVLAMLYMWELKHLYLLLFGR